VLYNTNVNTTSHDLHVVFLAFPHKFHTNFLIPVPRFKQQFFWFAFQSSLSSLVLQVSPVPFFYCTASRWPPFSHSPTLPSPFFLPVFTSPLRFKIRSASLLYVRSTTHLCSSGLCLRAVFNPFCFTRFCGTILSLFRSALSYRDPRFVSPSTLGHQLSCGLCDVIFSVFPYFFARLLRFYHNPSLFCCSRLPLHG
jgi:hypothetical protein